MKPKEAATLEFRIVTVIVCLALIFDLASAYRFAGISMTERIMNKLQHLPMNEQIPQFKTSFTITHYMRILFNYVIVYISYLLLFFYVAPAFEKKDAIRSNGTLLILVLISASILIGIINIYFAALLAIKLIVICFIRNRENKDNRMHSEAALLTASWILVLVNLSLAGAPAMLRLFVVAVLPMSIVLYIFSIYYLLPLATARKRNGWHYLGVMLGGCVVTSLLVLISTAAYHEFNYSGMPYYDFNGSLAADNIYFIIGRYREDAIILAVFINLGVQLSIITPLAWVTYKTRHRKYAEEILSLKTELGKSDANLHSLKSQINPHFLFNALNTLYGTALQENAERTSEGIQKLGDMMRVMLEENMQDKILLTRDLDYLKNYISLQQLRTSTSTGVIIETNIQDVSPDLLITPMLLIPFVENAFKHGISLINPSHIKINLHIHGNALYFDVHNSIHLKPANDPEKGQSGIGLDNVRQRLSLLYPGRHELIIRENGNDFFVHLTVELEIKANFEA